MYSVKINSPKQTQIEELESIAKELANSIEYAENNWNSPERNPAMLVGYLKSSIDQAHYLITREINNQKSIQENEK